MFELASTLCGSAFQAGAAPLQVLSGVSFLAIFPEIARNFRDGPAFFSHPSRPPTVFPEVGGAHTGGSSSGTDRPGSR
jgi:hypothetical protein